MVHSFPRVLLHTERKSVGARVLLSQNERDNACEPPSQLGAEGLCPPPPARSPSGVMTKKPLEGASAEAYPASTSSAASLSLKAFSSGSLSGSRPALWATSETIAGFPSSAPPLSSLSALRKRSRSRSHISGVS